MSFTLYLGVGRVVSNNYYLSGGTSQCDFIFAAVSHDWGSGCTDSLPYLTIGFFTDRILGDIHDMHSVSKMYHSSAHIGNIIIA